MKISEIGEFRLIERLKRAAPTNGSVRVGIGDDTAVVRGGGKYYHLLTTDMLIEGVHFRKTDPARWIGHKALACSLSDIAAMGGVAKYALISLGVSGGSSFKRIQDIYRGIGVLAKKYHVSVVGGDTIRSKKMVINIALMGEVQKSCLILRNGAKKGDAIFVTGSLGDSLKSGRHLKFNPRVKEAQFLVKKFKPNAMIDISDGLVSDLNHIITQSNAGAVIYEDRIPKRKGASLKQALYDGEDFELIFTLPKKKAQKFMQQKEFRFYQIGEITTQKRKLELITKKGESILLSKEGFRHF